MQDRRRALVIIEAAKGYRREARGLVARALRKALGVRKQRVPPHNVVYMSGAECREYDLTHRPGGQYTFDATDEEFRRFADTLQRMSEEEGWADRPTDSYHDY